MKRSFVILTGLTLLLSMPIISSAAVPGGSSDANLRWARARVERDIDMLQRDNQDYGGHREQAIDDMQRARYQILLGLSHDRNHDNIYNPSIFGGSNGLSRGDAGNNGLNRGNDCNGSDANLRYVRRDVENVIDALQRDNTDYGGHRADAIRDLQQAREQIVDALVFDATRE